MDWETLYCPHRHCHGYGKPFSQGSLAKNGTSRGQPRAWCTACEASVVLSYGTAYDGLEADPTIFETAVRALAEGKALRATAPGAPGRLSHTAAWRTRILLGLGPSIGDDRITLDDTTGHPHCPNDASPQGATP